MRSNRKIIFGLLLIVGAFGFYKAFRYISSLTGASPRVAAANTSANGAANNLLHPVSARMMPGHVVEARMNIPANSIVTPDMLRMSDKSLPSTEGYITDIESQGAGYITGVMIPKGAKIRSQGDLVGHVSETGIAGLLQPGTRAMIIPIANKPTLHDLVRIGNRVDVLAAFDGQESRTLIQDVRVLGVDVSANDYPNVNAAMRGPSKADTKRGVASADAGPPTATPTPAANAPRPDPAITLEVTPRQAAALQLALASNATLDYLIRPAIAGNLSNEVAPTEGVNGMPGTADAQTVSVVKFQIAPYAERKKGQGGGGRASAGGSGSTGGNGPARLTRGGRRPHEVNDSGPIFPPSGGTGVTPASIGDSGERFTAPSTPVPTPTQNYVIPVYGDGKILRTESVPLPDPSR